eukprot:1178299-Pleurochrysis_carterae.AAC.1
MPVRVALRLRVRWAAGVAAGQDVAAERMTPVKPAATLAFCAFRPALLGASRPPFVLSAPRPCPGPYPDLWLSP